MTTKQKTKQFRLVVLKKVNVKRSCIRHFLSAELTDEFSRPARVFIECASTNCIIALVTGDYVKNDLDLGSVKAGADRAMLWNG
jgi:hypothetical protein